MLPLLLAVSACTPAPADEGGLTVFAAASLRDLMSDLEAAWTDEHPGVPLTVATEASNVLAAQIAEGAPADILVSADTERPWALADDGLTAAKPVPFARNRIALVVPLESDLVDSPHDLATAGVRIVATNPGAPISRYTLEAIAQLAGTMPQPGVFTDAVRANVVSEEDNVRAALAKVELGEGDAAFVYRTDALSSELIREIPLPPEVQSVAEYAAVQISHRVLAAELLRWLAGPTANAVIEANGFDTPAP